MPFKLSFFVVSQVIDIAGWTENFWNSGTDVDVVTQRARNLRFDLRFLFGAQAYINKIRLSRYGVARDVTPVPVVGAAPWGISSLIADGDTPNQSVQLLLRATFNSNSYQTTQWLRGIPDDLTTNGGLFNVGTVWDQRFKAVAAVLQDPAQGWQMRCLDKGVTPKPIQTFNLTNGLITATGHGFPGPLGTPYKARVTGYNPSKQLNQVYNVSFVTADTLQVANWQSPGVIPTTGLNPQIRRQDWIFLPIQFAKSGNATTHQTGNPPRRRTGRRRRRAS